MHCYVHAMIYECEMCVFVRENKSLTTAVEILGVESLIACWKWRICISSNFIEGILLLGNITQISVVIWLDPGFTVAEDEVVGCYLVGSRFHNDLLGRDELTVIWSDPGFAENYLKLNSLLVGSRFHNNLLGMQRLTSIWSDPGFTVTYRRKRWINCYLVGSRLCRKFLEIE